ncbi:unnamed protein product, partial [Mesorhabditis belari]|uniref:Bromodomain adjacent to zinc finger domain protein 1A n=1 Tax=Mesorhabditis belari TaxID=2138241 RepID=A0AAF3EBT0_9BILA
MPLYNKRPWEKISPPKGLAPDIKVYYCEATDEIFTSYDEFFDRLMELNSTVWSCEYTNKSNLTFFEALESEQDAMKQLGQFPQYLEIPILWLVQELTCRGRFEDLLNDVYNFLKDRYFIGEEVTLSEGKKPATVIGITVDTNNYKEPAEKLKDMHAPSPEAYSYTLRIHGVEGENREKTGVQYMNIYRNKRVLGRQNLKLFLKNKCSVRNQEGERYVVLDKYLNRHGISERKWADLFAGPLPKDEAHADDDASEKGDKPEKSKTPKASRHSKKTPKAEKSEQSSPSKKPLSEKKKVQIKQQQAELHITFEKAKRAGVENLEKWQQTEKFLSKRNIDELNEAIKEARKREQEKHRKKKEALQSWARKRDDLECDDLKPMPNLPQIPLPEWLSDKMFGKMLDVLQFFASFAEFLPIKEKKSTTRVTLSDVVVALRCRDPRNSTFSILMEILLKARAEICDEEEGDEVDFSRRDEVVMEMNPDYEHPEHGAELKTMTRLHEEIRYTLGSSVRNLYTDWLSITEVLRLLFLTSGYVTRSGKHRHRLFQRGSIRFYEDPAYMYRIEHPDVIRKLEVSTVFDLEPEERLDLLHVIIQQLLTYAKIRNHATERVEEICTQRIELRKLKNWDTKQEAEAKDARLLREMEAEGNEVNIPKTSKDSMKLKAMLKAAQEGRRHDKEELRKILLAGIAWLEFDLGEICFARELQKTLVQEAIEDMRADIFEVSSLFGPCSLGRDRAFRNYFVCDQIPILLVENPGRGDRIGSCQAEATPCKNMGEHLAEDDWRQEVFACTAKMENCPVHGLKAQQRPKWTYVQSLEQLEEVLSACNPRGFREIALVEEINYLKPQLHELVEKTNNKANNGQLSQSFMEMAEDPAKQENSIKWLDVVIDMILELEEKMTEGFLGRLPSYINREEWRKSLDGNRRHHIDATRFEFIIGIPKHHLDDVVCEIKEREVLHSRENFESLTDIQKVGIAFLQVVQAINAKYIKKPFTRIAPGSVIEPTWTLIHWMRSVVDCKSPFNGKKVNCWQSVAFVERREHRRTLSFALECDKCYHLDCARPRLKEVVNPYSCQDCRVEEEVQPEENSAEKNKTNGHANGHVSDDEMDGNDENEASQSSNENSLSVVRTSSGRKVKRAEYNIERLSSLAPPKKKIARQDSNADSSVTNGSGNQEDDSMKGDDETEDSQSADEDTCSESDYDGRRKSKRQVAAQRRSTKNTSVNDSSMMSNRSFGLGLRDSDPNLKEKIKKLEDVIRLAMREEYAWPFLEPVDPKEVPDYRDVIKKPMDLRTIINKLKITTTTRLSRSKMMLSCEIYDCAVQLEEFWGKHLQPIFHDNSGRRRSCRVDFEK